MSKKNKNQQVLVLAILCVILIAMWGPSMFSGGWASWMSLCGK